MGFLDPIKTMIVAFIAIFLTYTDSLPAGSACSLPDSLLLKNILGIVNSYSNDSVKLEKPIASQIQKHETLRFLNKEFSSTVFTRSTWLATARVYRFREAVWSPAITISRYSENDIKQIRTLFMRDRDDSFLLAAWNRYSWHILGGLLILIETYRMDPLYERLRSEAFCLQASDLPLPANADSLYFIDTLSYLLKAMALLDTSLVALKKYLPVDTVTTDSSKLLYGRNTKAERRIRWAVDFSTPGSTVVSLKNNRTCPLPSAATLLKKYAPDIITVQSDKRVNLQPQSFYGFHPITLIVNGNREILWIALRQSALESMKDSL